IGDGARLPVVQMLGVSRADKHAVAATACARLGMRLYTLLGSDLPGSPTELASLLRLWERDAALLHAALLLDLDDLDGERASARKLVERARCGTLVSTRVGLSDGARPTLTVHVERPSTDEQRTLWR